jgi:hypothetical protein
MDGSTAIETAVGGDLHPKEPTAHKLLPAEVLFFTALLALAALVNTSTVSADLARSGSTLPLWRPFVWESSSSLVVLLLVPALAWALARFPLMQTTWRRNVPAHLLATALFSLVHTEGMVLLRKLAYAAAGERYDFGPFWDHWPYEYRKDFLTYWVLVGALLAFRVYGLWLDASAARMAERDSTSSPTTDAPRHSPSQTDPSQSQTDPSRLQSDPPQRQTDPSQSRNDSPQARIVVHRLNREFILDAGEIDRIESDGNYVIVHSGGQSYRLRDSLDGINRRLGAQRFARVHRGHVVNIDRIREIQPWDNGDYRILLKDGSFLNFSRRYRSRLNQLFR